MKKLAASALAVLLMGIGGVHAVDYQCTAANGCDCRANGGGSITHVPKGSIVPTGTGHVLIGPHWQKVT